MVLGYGPVFWSFMDGFSPRLAARAKKVEALNRAQLLSKRAARVSGQDVTTRDLILQVAHVSGGVHAGSPETDLQRLLAGVSESVRIGGVSAVSRTLRGISDVVVLGLEPLTAEVRRGRGT
jgi:hypothetical protein